MGFYGMLLRLGNWEWIYICVFLQLLGCLLYPIISIKFSRGEWSGGEEKGNFFFFIYISMYSSYIKVVIFL